MKWTHWMCALALVTTAACGGDEAEAEAEAEAAIDELSAALNTVAAEATAEVANEAVAEANEAAGEANTAGQAANAQGLAAMGEALGAALEASAMAEGNTPCEQAWNGVMAMMQAMQKQMGGPGQGNLPDQATFMDACNQLPEAAQQCMVPAYAMQHMQECQAAQNDPQVQRIRELMRGNSAMN